MAAIEEDAPFSRFPGQARTLGVVDGEGIELTVDGRMQPLRFGEVFGPFSGGLPASARPLGGPALDLGLILDPSRVQGEMTAIGAGEHDLVGLTWFVVSLVDGLTFALNHGEPVALARWDTAALDLRSAPIARLTLAAASGGPVAYLVSISR
jgi:environmental stress-induced protein Ves